MAALLRAKVHVTLKPGVLDPQGKAVQHSLAALGFEGVQQVRQGKYIEVDLAETDRERARATLDAMCRQLLANTVIEDYTIDIAAAAAAAPGASAAETIAAGAAPPGTPGTPGTRGTAAPDAAE